MNSFNQGFTAVFIIDWNFSMIVNFAVELQWSQVDRAQEDREGWTLVANKANY
jgi:hypothetical protein